MNKKVNPKNSEAKIDEILEMIVKISSLDFSNRIDHRADDETISAICFGLNVIAEELESNVVNRSELELQNERLKKLLTEKEVMLSEIHHRVKNNLQITSSLLRLQSANVHDGKAREVLETSMSRISTMAIIHNKLYESPNFTDIDIGDYLQELIRLQESIYEGRQKGIETQLTTDLEGRLLSIDNSVVIGLIVNELLSNTFKHAFPEDQQGKVTVDLRFVEQTLNGAKFRLVVKDDGIGSDLTADLEVTESLGLQLVQSLTTQIEGQLCVEGNNGTAFTIDFVEFS